MKICLVSSIESPVPGGMPWAERLAASLASRHEVTLIDSRSAALRADCEGLVFACEEHRRSAAVLQAIEERYGAGEGPDYVEFADAGGLGLVTLQARAVGHQLLRGTLVGVRQRGCRELAALHDGASEQGEERRVADIEREQLRLADRLIGSAEDALGLYRRYYDGVALPEAALIPLPPLPARPPLPAGDAGAAAPLRILYVGDLRRRLGVLDLVEACLGLEDEGWELTLIGADTETAAMRQSMALTAAMMAAGDPRVRVLEPLAEEGMAAEWARHDLFALPAEFELAGDAAGVAQGFGLPVLATPVAGLASLIEPGVNGWLAGGTGAVALAAALARLQAERDEVTRLRDSDRVRAPRPGEAAPERVLAAYDELLGGAGRRRTSTPSAAAGGDGGEPLISAVIPHFHTSTWVAEAVGSLLAQTHSNLEVILVNDGSFEAEDAVLDELAAEPRVTLVNQLNAGDQIARNLGIGLARGEYLLMFDADNVAEPMLAERLLRALRTSPELTYATCWLRFVDPDGAELSDGTGFAALGNRVLRDEEENKDGDTVALFPRAALAAIPGPYSPRAVTYADWNLYRRLREAGAYGTVVPETLVRYRIRPGSMLRAYAASHHRAGSLEMRDWRRLDAVRAKIEAEHV